MNTRPPLFDVHALGIGHGRRRVLSDLSLTLHRGELLCLLGPNGSGKTTLLRTLLGLVPPQVGSIRLLNRPLSHWSRNALARHVGYVPQAHAGLFAFTVLDIVLMGRAAQVGRFAIPSQHDRAIALHCLDTLGIATLAQRTYTKISGGERQLALVARALAQEPDVLLLDEPTASLDFGNQIRVLEHLGQLRALGIAILMSTHQPDHALRCADRTALVGDGRLLALGPTTDVATAAQLARLYGVSEGAIAASLPAIRRASAD
ncbi:ABC transporter ATP-binding protein [Xanthomonadaceae bacterium JHOS43]|nr:ABC transporter ATP-binding protein [Xanthomonadaceae bacterium JHOS43]